MSETRKNQVNRAKNAAAAAEPRISRDDLAALQELLGAEVLEQSPEGTALAKVRGSYFVVDDGIVRVNTLSLPYARERFAQLTSRRREIISREKKKREQEALERAREKAAEQARREAEEKATRELLKRVIDKARLVSEMAGRRAG